MILDERYREWAATHTDEAREALFAEIRRRVLKTTRDEDIAQNVCITVLHKLESFNPVDEYAFTRFISAVTTKHRLKQAVAHSYEPLELQTEIAAAEPQFISLSELQPFAQQVATSILAGNSLRETADNIGMKPATLRKKLQRTREITNRS